MSRLMIAGIITLVILSNLVFNELKSMNKNPLKDVCLKCWFDR